MSIENDLELLANAYEVIEAAEAERAKKRAAIMETVQAELDALDVEYSSAISEANETAIKLTEQIKAEVITLGKSVKGTRLQAVFSKGRVSWDSKALDGYALAHPEILTARKEGEPIVSIR